MVFVGRRDELKQLERAVAGARGTMQRHAVVVEGHPGLGKTALIDEFVRRLPGGTTVLRISPVELEAATAWSALRALTAAWPIDHLPTPVAVATGRTHADAAPQLADVAYGWLDAARRAVPAIDLVVIDDAHWCDQSTASALAVSMRELPVTWVLGTRPGQLSIDVDRLLPDERRTRVVVGAMSAGDLADVVVESATRTLPPHRVDEIVALAAGSPLLARELAREVGRDSHDTPPHGLSGARPHLLYRDRFETLGSNARRLIGLASLAAPPDLDAVADGLDGAALRDALDEVERSGLARLAGPGIAFTHPLARRAVADSLRPVERLSLHAHLAARVGDTHRRAVHLGASTLQPDADVASALEAEAEAALRRGATDAVDLFARSIELTPPVDVADRWRRRVAGGVAAAAIGDYPRADEFLAGLSEAELDGELVGRAAGALMAVADRLRGKEAAAQVARDVLDRVDAGPHRARTWRLLVRIQQHVDLDVAEQTAKAALADAELTGSGADVLAAEVALANVAYLRGHAVPVTQLADAVARAGLGGGIVSASALIQELLTWDDQFEAGRSLLTDLEHEARAAGRYTELSELLAQRSFLEFRAGAIDLSEQLALETLAIVHPPAGAARFLTADTLLQIAGLRGDRHGVTDIVESAREEIDALDPAARILFHSYAGFAALSLGDARAAVDHLVRADDAASEYGMSDTRSLGWQADLAEALLLTGNLAGANEVVEQLADAAALSASTIVKVDHLRSLGSLRLATGDLAGALEPLTTAATLAPTTGRPLVVARCLLALGSAQRRAGRRRDARESLSQARSILEQLDAAPWIERVDDELRRAGHQERSSHAAALTPTERQIASLVAQGRSNREIAAELIVSLRTVESNLTRVYRKLGVRSRTELAARGPGEYARPT